MKRLRRIIKRGFKKIDIPTVSPPPENYYNEIYDVIDQYENKVNEKDLQIDLDKNPEKLFDKILIDNGLKTKLKYIKKISESIEPIILFYKYLYNKKRPSKHAEEKNIDWSGDDNEMKTVFTPSYPSGHSTQAYFLAYNLSDKYPEYEKDFFILADAVATSRIDRGVHYPSDIEAGKKLAYDLYNRRKNS